MKTVPFYTIGHSNRTIEQFSKLLKDAGIAIVADVRKIRASRRNPQFGEKPLAHHLASIGLEYAIIEDLSGRRTKSKTVSPEVNAENGS